MTASSSLPTWRSRMSRRRSSFAGLEPLFSGVRPGSRMAQRGAQVQQVDTIRPVASGNTDTTWVAELQDWSLAVAARATVSGCQSCFLRGQLPSGAVFCSESAALACPLKAHTAAGLLVHRHSPHSRAFVGTRGSDGPHPVWSRVAPISCPTPPFGTPLRPVQHAVHFAFNLAPPVPVVESAGAVVETHCLQRRRVQRVTLHGAEAFVRSVLLRCLRRWRPDAVEAETVLILFRARAAGRHTPPHDVFAVLRGFCHAWTTAAAFAGDPRPRPLGFGDVGGQSLRHVLRCPVSRRSLGVLGPTQRLHGLSPGVRRTLSRSGRPLRQSGTRSCLLCATSRTGFVWRSSMDPPTGFWLRPFSKR